MQPQLQWSSRGAKISYTDANKVYLEVVHGQGSRVSDKLQLVIKHIWQAKIPMHMNATLTNFLHKIMAH